MNRKNLINFFVFILFFFNQYYFFANITYSSIEIEYDISPQGSQTDPIIADHTITNMVRLDLIPESAIEQAKLILNISYGHTSHGSQITTGMSGLSGFKEANGGTVDLYDWYDGVDDDNKTLNLDDYGMSGDLGNPDRTSWTNRTRGYLDSHPYCNVIIWSWCGQVSGTEEQIANDYLANMNQLESEHPEVHFVYMTGHVDGGGLEGTVHIRNEQIRDYCVNNNKILLDFADIESYDPDGNYYGDQNVNDNCNYGDEGGNWAIEWQNSHTEGVDWYDCSSAHSEPLNANMKAYAAWWLWAQIAGWEGIQGEGNIELPNPNEIPGYDNTLTLIIIGIAIFIIKKRIKKSRIK